MWLTGNLPIGIPWQTFIFHIFFIKKEMIKIFCVYKITNLINHKLYIGITKRNPKIRFNEHFSNKNELLYKAKEKYDLWLKKCKRKPKVVVIPNMIKENTSGSISALNNNQIISIGRLEPVKDFYTLILVFSLLIKNYPKLILKIIGEGSQRAQLENLVKECNLQNSVVFTGKLNETEINEELLKSDVFVLTSKSESFSLVLCEAMSYGVPCVAFDVDVGPREIIANGVDGFLIENRNLNLMVEKIQCILNDNFLRKKMGSNAYINVEKFYPKCNADRWKEIF